MCSQIKQHPRHLIQQPKELVNNLERIKLKTSSCDASNSKVRANNPNNKVASIEASSSKMTQVIRKPTPQSASNLRSRYLNSLGITKDASHRPGKIKPRLLHRASTPKNPEPARRAYQKSPPPSISKMNTTKLITPNSPTTVLHQRRLDEPEQPKVSSSSPLRQRTKSVSFDDNSITVHHIPTRTDYSQHMREVLWINPNEMYTNVTRNATEFAAENYNWREAMEERDMVFVEATGEFIHPIHIIRHQQQQHQYQQCNLNRHFLLVLSAQQQSY